MKPTRLSTLVLVALACALLAWASLRKVYLSLPPLPWTGVPALALLAAGEAYCGRTLRTRLARRGPGPPPPPIAVARMAVLARASSLAAALVGGLAAGFLGYVGASLGKPAFRSDALASGLTLIAALALTAAALYLEHACRVPPSDEEEPPLPPPPPGHH